MPQSNRACQVTGGVTITAAAGETESSGTSGHSWHVHAAALPMPSDCATAGGHYDPAGVEVAGYSCDPANPGACYKGDLAGKFGALSLSGTRTEARPGPSLSARHSGAAGFAQGLRTGLATAAVTLPLVWCQTVGKLAESAENALYDDAATLRKTTRRASSPAC